MYRQDLLVIIYLLTLIKDVMVPKVVVIHLLAFHLVQATDGIFRRYRTDDFGNDGTRDILVATYIRSETLQPYPT